MSLWFIVEINYIIRTKNGNLCINTNQWYWSNSLLSHVCYSNNNSLRMHCFRAFLMTPLRYLDCYCLELRPILPGPSGWYYNKTKSRFIETAQRQYIVWYYIHEYQQLVWNNLTWWQILYCDIETWTANSNMHLYIWLKLTTFKSLNSYSMEYLYTIPASHIRMTSLIEQPTISNLLDELTHLNFHWNLLLRV